MHAWIITNGPDQTSEDTAYLAGRLTARFTRLSISHADPEASAAPPPPPDADVVLNRTRGKNPDFFEDLGRLAGRLGLPVTNPPRAAIRANDKRTYPEDFPDLVPETRVVGDLQGFREAFEDLGGDVVIKEPFSSRGRHVRRISSPADERVAESLLAEAREGSIVVQPYLSGFAEGDLRIITQRGPDRRQRAIAWFVRVPPPGSWLCSISQGGRSIIREPRRVEIDLALEVAERSGLDYAQLDFGWHGGRLYLIETNQSGGGYIDFDIGHRANCGDAFAEFVEGLARDRGG